MTLEKILDQLGYELLERLPDDRFKVQTPQGEEKLSLEELQDRLPLRADKFVSGPDDIVWL